MNIILIIYYIFKSVNVELYSSKLEAASIKERFNDLKKHRSLGKFDFYVFSQHVSEDASWNAEYPKLFHFLIFNKMFDLRLQTSLKMLEKTEQVQAKWI